MKTPTNILIVSAALSIFTALFDYGGYQAEAFYTIAGIGFYVGIIWLAIKVYAKK